MIVRRAGRRIIAVGPAAWLVPLAAYAGWFAAHHDRFSLSSEDGIFLWARTTSFADWEVIKPPAELIPLCPSRRHVRSWPLSFLLDIKSPSHYLSDPHEWFSGSPRRPVQSSGPHAGPPTDLAGDNEKAWRFAVAAIHAQPLDYALTVARDTAYTVLMAGPPVQSQAFRFQSAPPFSLSPQNVAALHRYAHDDARTRVAGVPAAALRYYQDRVFLSGVQFTLILALGLGCYPRKTPRRWAGAAALGDRGGPAGATRGDRPGRPSLRRARPAARLPRHRVRLYPPLTRNQPAGKWYPGVSLDRL